MHVLGLLCLSFLFFCCNSSLFEQKLQLKSDCERELEEVRLKYDRKLQDDEVEFQKKMKILDSNLSLVLMNKIWAEAFKSKCMDLKVSGASVLEQGIILIILRDSIFLIYITFTIISLQSICCDSSILLNFWSLSNEF